MTTVLQIYFDTEQPKRFGMPKAKKLNMRAHTFPYTDTQVVGLLVGWLDFYGISTFVGYLTSNPFLFKLSVLFQIIQFSMSTQFNCQRYFYFKLHRLTDRHTNIHRFKNNSKLKALCPTVDSKSN